MDNTQLNFFDQLYSKKENIEAANKALLVPTIKNNTIDSKVRAAYNKKLNQIQQLKNNIVTLGEKQQQYFNQFNSSIEEPLNKLSDLKIKLINKLDEHFYKKSFCEHELVSISEWIITTCNEVERYGSNVIEIREKYEDFLYGEDSEEDDSDLFDLIFNEDYQKEDEKNNQSAGHKSKKVKPQSKEEELLETDFSKLYKKLAKDLHPDLEQDVSVRDEKEVLMKKLTEARRNKDFYQLLSIQNSLNHFVNDSKEDIKEDQLSRWDKILDAQLKLLKKQYQEKIDGSIFAGRLKINQDLGLLKINELIQEEEKYIRRSINIAILDLELTRTVKSTKEYLREMDNPFFLI